ncbi:MAG: hypothetical protein FWE97_03350 [Dehalococcoidia bacterium]|nr:hypothetical protein [Dehalococcoidia bacterium]
MPKFQRGHFIVEKRIELVFTDAQAAQLKSLFSAAMQVPESCVIFDGVQTSDWTPETITYHVWAHTRGNPKTSFFIQVEQHEDFRRKLGIIWRTLRRDKKFLSNTEIYRIGGDAALKSMGIDLKRKPAKGIKP